MEYWKMEKIRSYYELRILDNGEKITKMRTICRELNVYDSEHLIVWFCNRFNSHDLNYFEDWVKRYLKGTQYFISRMDNISLKIFKEVFLNEK